MAFRRSAIISSRNLSEKPTFSARLRGLMLKVCVTIDRLSHDHRIVFPALNSELRIELALLIASGDDGILKLNTSN